MTAQRVRLQPLTRARVASLGDAGAAWVAGLPRVLDDLAERWGLTWGRPLPGGSASYVAGATTAAGEPRVVKVPVPDADLADEPRTLRAAAGRGYVRLHDHDPASRALLLEALGPSLEQTAWEPERTLAVLADTLREAWHVPLATAPEVVAGEDKASTLARLLVDLDDRLGRPLAPRVRTHALACAERRAAAHDPERCVVVHGDPHPANVLRVREERAGAPGGFVLVDPDGFRADPAYDLGVTLREWTGRLRGPDAPQVLGRYADLLAERTGLDRTAIWEWGFLERVTTGLYVTSFGAAKVGRTFIESAERLV
ncbi:phosphotransferase [Nocardioides sp. zg-579]|uniref:Phosphotransferase n=1 Tax=Nocardioides marmotae TaxID=2663857 RepID=A0A6I3JCX8_9ACTN|nr:aminoglycoside phosphotransferase family protein [Nocardioides marmotae]MCR6032293.1 phosphotransferase [Gordonia jinghuaiqii]MTB95941.1 phosphotransferase [Nocardioides marmotae]QKE02722.1 phosphotransferase [Nocardioides marmotae]